MTYVFNTKIIIYILHIYLNIYIYISYTYIKEKPKIKIEYIYIYIYIWLKNTLSSNHPLLASSTLCHASKVSRWFTWPGPGTWGGAQLATKTRGAKRPKFSKEINSWLTNQGSRVTTVDGKFRYPAFTTSWGKGSWNPHYLHGFVTYFRWLFGISEPSTVSTQTRHIYKGKSLENT